MVTGSDYDSDMEKVVKTLVKAATFVKYDLEISPLRLDGQVLRNGRFSHRLL
jgi:hypothetical protein